MFEILRKDLLADRIWKMVVHAPNVTERCLPGQFLIVRNGEDGERIPLTICDYDRGEGPDVVIVMQDVGAATLGDMA